MYYSAVAMLCNTCLVITVRHIHRIEHVAQAYIHMLLPWPVNQWTGCRWALKKCCMCICALYIIYYICIKIRWHHSVWYMCPSSFCSEFDWEMRTNVSSSRVTWNIFDMESCILGCRVYKQCLFLVCSGEILHRSYQLRTQQRRLLCHYIDCEITLSHG